MGGGNIPQGIVPGRPRAAGQDTIRGVPGHPGDIRNPQEFSGKLLPLLTALVSLITAILHLIKRV